MEEHPEFSFKAEILDHLVSPAIVGSFCIKNRQYLVIHVEREDSAPTGSHALPTAAQLEGRQFEIDGQHCVIVDAEQRSSTACSDIVSLLTERELQVVKCVALGHPNKQIAKQLHISEWTVSTHLRRIFAKLGVDSRAAMVYRCAALLHN
jgi:DNA-binding NarL/FixJ family response regulator